ANTVQRLACDASLRPLLIDRHGQLIAMLPRTRVIHPALRRAILTRDQHCRFPHCKQRIDEIHHIRYHSRGGPTTPDNLTGLCRYHHHHIHDHRWRITGNPNTALHFHSPHHHTHTTHPPGLDPDTS
ncbi:MAG: HNH endonuclease, partial [bacterium]